MHMNKEVVMVRLTDIIPNRFQPRLTFDEEALNELANSIREHGIIQPLILRNLGSKYEIIAGERRYKAATIAGLSEVPAIIGTMDDQTSAELALIENIQRKDLSAIEEAKSYKKILDLGNLTQDLLAKRMGKSQSTIANKMRLLSLTNEVQMALMNNLISERHARCLLQIKDEDLQKEVLNKIITERMNVRDTDEYVKNLLGLPKTEAPVQNQETIKPSVQIPIPNEINTTNNQISQMNTENNNINELDNPNVYAESQNNNYVSIDSLNTNNIPSNKEVVNNALNEVNINTQPLPEEKIEMPVELETTIPEENKKENMTKLKLATAIRLAKDAVEDIASVGYNVTMEEKDDLRDYQIIIKVEK